MTRITLQPIDDGQKTVEIPVGKTTIGRGFLLGCGDKKVSRNHAILEVTEQGEVFLTPTHVNPCFYQPTAESPGTILKKDKPHKLQNGDLFSLLPRAFRYKLVIHSGDSGGQSSANNADNSDKKVNGMAEDAKAGVNGESSSKRQGECSGENKKSVAVSADMDINGCYSGSLVQPYIETPPPEMEDGNCDMNMIPPVENLQPKVEEAAKEQQPDEDEDEEEEEDEEGEEEEEEGEVEKKKEKEEQETVLEEAEKDEDSSSRNSRTLPDWVTESSLTAPMISKEEKKRPKTTKQHHREKASAKRKTDESSSPEKKRKKKNSGKLDDDRMEHPQRQSTGRSSRTNRQTRQTISLDDFVASDDDEWQSDKSEPKIRKKRKTRRRDDDSGSDWEIEHKKSKKVSHKFTSGSESGSDWGSSSQKKKKTSKVRRRRSKRVLENETISDEEEDEEEEEKSSSGKQEKRLSCQYGKKCFRKNPAHLDQYSHPGDSDYESDAEGKHDNDADENASGSDEVSDLPECPYGISCFRKNSQHKKEYKHTKKVRPQREAAKQTVKKTNVSKDGEEAENFDHEDSFVNDDSDEYKPNESGSDLDGSQESSSPAKGAKQPTKNKKAKRV